MNYYAKAISVLVDVKNGDKILIELAKKHPKYVYEAHLKVNGKTRKEIILSHYFEGHSKFECVQLYRRITKEELGKCIGAVDRILPVIKEKKKK